MLFCADVKKVEKRRTLAKKKNFFTEKQIVVRDARVMYLFKTSAELRFDNFNEFFSTHIRGSDIWRIKGQIR